MTLIQISLGNSTVFYGIARHQHADFLSIEQNSLGNKKKQKRRSFLTSQTQGLRRLEIAREPGFVGFVRLSTLLPKHIIQPGTLGLQLLVTAAVHHSEVQPGCGVSNGSDLVTDVGPCVQAHLLVEVQVGE